MNKQRTARIALVVLALGFYHADAASAQDAPAAADEALIEPIKTEHQYDLTEAGKHIAVERVKTVLSPKRKRYISIDRVPDEGRSDLRVTAFHERDADGTLRKYARKEKVRKGKGIRAFRRGVGIRIVGLNQKLESFFDLCAERGLTGRQGVIVPAANHADLVLAQRVVDAVRTGEFHIWRARHIDQVLGLACGMTAGARDESGQFPPDSLNARVRAGLRKLVEQSGTPDARKGR